MIKMHIAKYRFVVFFICVCVLYLVLPKVYPRVFEPHKADGGISNVVIYDGQPSLTVALNTTTAKRTEIRIGMT